MNAVIVVSVKESNRINHKLLIKTSNLCERLYKNYNIIFNFNNIVFNKIIKPKLFKNKLKLLAE